MRKFNEWFEGNWLAIVISILFIMLTFLICYVEQKVENQQKQINEIIQKQNSQETPEGIIQEINKIKDKQLDDNENVLEQIRSSDKKINELISAEIILQDKFNFLLRKNK